MNTPDIVIIGASFAGLTLAHHLPKHLKVLILDRKLKLNAGIESTGLITQATKDLLASFIDIEKFIPNKVTHIGVISPDYNKYFFSQTKNPWIYTTDTPELVKEMSKNLPPNVTLKIGANVTKIDFAKEPGKPSTIHYRQNNQVTQVTAKFIVGADGAHSTVATQNPNLSQNKKFLAGLEKVYYGNINLGPNPETTVYHFWFGEFSLGYGGWLSPTIINGKPTFRVGLAKMQKDIKELKKLDEFIKILAQKKIITLEEKTPTQEPKSIFTFGSLIPIGGILKKPFTHNSLLLGDAAGLCGAFAADGIKGAVISGMVAAELIPQHLAGDQQALKKYYPIIEKDYRKMITYYRKQLLYRFVWNRMKSNRSFHAMFDIIAKEKETFLNQFCDSKDKNSSLMWVVLKVKHFPALCKFAIYLLLDLFKK